VAQFNGDFVYVPHGFNGLEILKLTRTSTEPPHFIASVGTGGLLTLTWNDAANGFTLQRASVISGADWQDVPGSEAVTTLEVPITEAAGFFRLIRH
jgi:hypothetical protein